MPKATFAERDRRDRAKRFEVLIEKLREFRRDASDDDTLEIWSTLLANVQLINRMAQLGASEDTVAQEQEQVLLAKKLRTSVNEAIISVFSPKSENLLRAMEEAGFSLANDLFESWVSSPSALVPAQGASTLLRSVDVLAELTAEDLKWRLRTLVDWFEDAHTSDDGIDDSLPSMSPPIVWYDDVVTEIVDGNPITITGWVNLLTQEAVPDTAIGKAFADGYLAERKYVERLRKEIMDLRQSLAMKGRPRPEIDAMIADTEAVLEKMRRAVGFQDFFRRRLVPTLEDPFRSSTPIPSADMIAAPWREAAATNGMLSQHDLDALKVMPGRWAWEPDHNKEVVYERSPPDDPVVDDLLARLLEVNGEDLAARFARIAVRFNALENPKTTNRIVLNLDNVKHPLFPIAAAGEPDPRRLKPPMVLTEEAHRFSFEGNLFPRGSAGEYLFALPPGSVVVWPKGEAPYLRGRGWRVTCDRRLLAWSGDVEPDWIMPFGGVDQPPGPCEGENLSPVAYHGWVSHRGLRWWNVDGSGELSDETLYEWEDRRFRVREQAWAALKSKGPSGLSASQWRWVHWNFIGHYFGDHSWRLPPSGWRWLGEDGPGHVAPGGKRLAFVTGLDSAPSEWSEVQHNRKWMGDVLPQRMRDHALVRALQCRPGGTTEPFVEVLLESVREAMEEINAHPGRRKAFEDLRLKMLGGVSLDVFWERAEAQRRFDAEVAAQWATDVEDHRKWMRQNCRVAVVPDPSEVGEDHGPTAVLRFVPWTHDFAPEPLLVPEQMRMPFVPDGVGYDFTRDKDKGAGLPDKPAPFMDPGYMVKLMIPSAHAQIFENVASMGDPVVQPDLSVPLGATSVDDPAMIAAAAAARGESVDEFLERDRRCLAEIERLLFR
jgi:hypothetical protein